MNGPGAVNELGAMNELGAVHEPGGVPGADVARTMVLRCPDWPVAAWGMPPTSPAAVLVANRVVAATPAARAEGVALAMRRRDAQARCPALVIFDREVDREARLFEPVVAAVAAFTPLVEIAVPGSCAFPTRGPSRYFGGDAALSQQVARAANQALGKVVRGWACHVGIADGTFAASLAASRASPGGPVVVSPGATPSFLAPFPIASLDRPDLADVLIRLGLATLGAFAALEVADVLGRFGRAGADAHRLARGLDPRPADVRQPPPDLASVMEFDPPLERVDQAAFAAKTLADQLCGQLDDRGLSCMRLAISAETAHGETLLRHWRHEGALTPAAMAQRVRWQLEGWLVGPASAQPTGGLTRLSLLPDQVVAATGRQLGFWGGETQAAERAARAVAKVAGLLGPEAVHVAEPRGGRSPLEQFSLVPATAVDLVERADPRPAVRSARGRSARQSGAGTGPWPGRLPLPSPARTFPAPQRVEVLDTDEKPVTVSGRGLVSAPPAWAALGPPSRPDRQAVLAWAGPWPLEERWWDPASYSRQARFQVVLADGSAHLVALQQQVWRLMATYD